MSGWRRCEKCRKVLANEQFDGEATTCTPCLTAPPPKAKASAVTTKRAATRPAAAKPEPSAPAERRPLLGTVGSGDLEVRERRARRAAAEALAQSHPDEFALLLRDARAAEGLRPLSVETPPPPAEGT